MTIILGIDPGNTTGLALIEVRGGNKIFPIVWEESKDTTTDSYSDLILQADVIVLENWRTRPKKARQGAFDWDPMVTSQIIGAIKLQAKREGKILAIQEPYDKPVGYGFSNQVYKPGKKGMHKQDALAHAVFYAVKKLGALPVSPS